MEPENEISICKFYIKKCCKHGLRAKNCNYPHPAQCKKCIENSENGCRPECINYHLDICKYSMKLRKCYNVNCCRIHLKGTMRERSSQAQQCASTIPQTNQFHNPYHPANSAFENKPHKNTSSFIPHNSTGPCISSNTLIPRTNYSLLPLLDFELPPPKLPATLITKTQSQ